ncbi:conserved hypothetical protein [Ricinus communis]|uniref:Uncharacterized protein n=1 Tax=Ricinus communis TaxID=3988 RepID=B9TD43_RICCO|nr:conserved hypothetical protein [Ricinus communis]
MSMEEKKMKEMTQEGQASSQELVKGGLKVSYPSSLFLKPEDERGYATFFSSNFRPHILGWKACLFIFCPTLSYGVYCQMKES